MIVRHGFAGDGGPVGVVQGRLPFGLERMRRLPSVVLAFADQGVVSAANFMVVVAVARSAGIEEFGRFSLAFSALLFCSSLIYAVMVQPLSVLLPERSGEEVRAYFARMERCQRWLVPMMIAIGVPIALAVGSWQLVLATAVAVATRMAAESHRRSAYAMQDSLRALLIDAVAYGSLAIFALCMLLSSHAYQAWEAMAAIAVAGGLGWLAGCWVHAGLVRGRPEPFAPVARRHWDFGKWNLGGALAMWGASQLYPFLVAGQLGLREVGLLNGSMRIMGINHIVIQGIEAFATPRLRRTFVTSDLETFRQSLRRSALLGCAVIFPVCLLIVVFAEQIMTALLGQDFAGGGFVLRMMALIQVFAFLGRMAAVGLNSLKDPRPGFWSQGACAVATILLGPLIVAHFGLAGACYALLANAFAVFLILTLSFFRLLRRLDDGRGDPQAGAAHAST